MTRRARLAAFCILFRLPSYSQFLPDLQAKTPAEYDAYLATLDGSVIEKGPAFEQAFPISTLRLPVCELLANAYRARGQASQALAAAARGLAIAPDYVPLLVDQADLLANNTTDLDRAADSAQRALDLLETAKAPARISPEDWIEATSKLRARAYTALGLVRFKRGDNPGAIRLLETALAQRTPAEPALHYRLGRLYAITGRMAEAKSHLELAARSTDKSLRDLAIAALALHIPK